MWYIETKTLWRSLRHGKNILFGMLPCSQTSRPSNSSGRTRSWNAQKLCRNSGKCGRGSTSTRRMMANTMFSTSPSPNRHGGMSVRSVRLPRRENARNASLCGIAPMAACAAIRLPPCDNGKKPRLQIPTCALGTQVSLSISPAKP